MGCNPTAGIRIAPELRISAKEAIGGGREMNVAEGVVAWANVDRGKAYRIVTWTRLSMMPSAMA